MATKLISILVVCIFIGVIALGYGLALEKWAGISGEVIWTGAKIWVGFVVMLGAILYLGSLGSKNDQH